MSEVNKRLMGLSALFVLVFFFIFNKLMLKHWRCHCVCVKGMGFSGFQMFPFHSVLLLPGDFTALLAFFSQNV